jgi:hypothetical protein
MGQHRRYNMKSQAFWDVALGKQFPAFQRITVPSSSASSRPVALLGPED